LKFDEVNAMPFISRIFAANKITAPMIAIEIEEFLFFRNNPENIRTIPQIAEIIIKFITYSFYDPLYTGKNQA
jgi:hypothetical protein